MTVSTKLRSTLRLRVVVAWARTQWARGSSELLRSTRRARVSGESTDNPHSSHRSWRNRINSSWDAGEVESTTEGCSSPVKSNLPTKRVVRIHPICDLSRNRSNRPTTAGSCTRSTFSTRAVFTFMRLRPFVSCSTVSLVAAEQLTGLYRRTNSCPGLSEVRRGPQKRSENAAQTFCKTCTGHTHPARSNGDFGTSEFAGRPSH